MQTLGPVKSSCLGCCHAAFMDLKTAQELRRTGYKQGTGVFLFDQGFVCERNRMVAAVPKAGCGFSPQGQGFEPTRPLPG